MEQTIQDAFEQGYLTEYLIHYPSDENYAYVSDKIGITR